MVNSVYNPRLLQEDLSEMRERLRPTSRRNLPGGLGGYVRPGMQNGAGLRGEFASDHQMHFSQALEVHEEAHLYGVDGSPSGEYQADAIAAERTGNPFFMRSLIYRPPINLN
ncbi:MAG: hypothetical protein ABIH92_03215 [Nanoarchaeota archaeon]